MPCQSQWGNPCSEPLGFCSNESICMCTFPNIAIGDFAVDPSEDCELDQIIVQGFWLACGGLHFLCLVVNVIALCRAHGEFSIERKYLWAISLCNVCFVVLGALEGSASSAGERSIGIDPLATTIFALGGSTYWITIELLLFVQTRLNPLPLGFQRVQWLRAIHMYSIPIQMAISTCAFLLIFGMIADPDNAYTYASLHYLMLGTLILVVGLVMIFSMSVIIRDVQKAVLATSENHQRLDKVIHVFSQLRAVTFSNLLVCCAVSFAFGSSTKLMRKSPYFLPLIWGSTALFFLGYASSQIAISKNSFASSRTDVTSERVVLSDNQQIILPGRLGLSISSPRSGRLRRKGQHQKVPGLSRVDEGTYATLSDQTCQ